MSSEKKSESSKPEESKAKESNETNEVEKSGEAEEKKERKTRPAAKSKRKKRRKKGSKKRRKAKRSSFDWKKAAIIGSACVAAVLAVYFGVSAYFINHFYLNTTINGKDFSGKTASDVKEYIQEQVKEYSLTIVEMNNEQDVITGKDISLTYKENSEIEDALEAQNAFLWPKALFGKSSEKVTVEVGYDEAALDAKIQAVKAIVQEQTQPTSAFPTYDGSSYVIAPEVYGTAVNKEVLVEAIKTHINEFDETLNMEEEGCYVQPKFTSESPEVQAACDTLNQYITASITYTMDQEVVVDKELIASWLSYDENMQPVISQDAVREWLRQFGKTYDTLGSTRTITSPTGKTVEVSGGTYGWSVDEAAEAENLMNSIKNGENVKREPAYVQKAAVHGKPDWGTTYLEVDRSAQHMWYIVDGRVALETDVVTGLPTADRETPTGVYFILYTQKDATLVGETNPATGQPSYRTKVGFWMPFTQQGHGFHDATWQSAFGGSRYRSYGSHGCVNMPLDQAGNLYSMLSSDTPVIVHD